MKKRKSENEHKREKKRKKEKVQFLIGKKNKYKLCGWWTNNK